MTGSNWRRGACCIGWLAPGRVECASAVELFSEAGAEGRGHAEAMRSRPVWGLVVGVVIGQNLEISWNNEGTEDIDFQARCRNVPAFRAASCSRLATGASACSVPVFQLAEGEFLVGPRVLGTAVAAWLPGVCQVPTHNLNNTTSDETSVHHRCRPSKRDSAGLSTCRHFTR